MAKPSRPHLNEELAQPDRGDNCPRSMPAQWDAPKIFVQGLRRQLRKHHPPHRGTVSGKPAADGEIDGHDPGHMSSCDVEQLVAVERGHEQDSCSTPLSCSSTGWAATGRRLDDV